MDTLDILYRNFWPLVILFALSDAMMYGLHRVSHRITNEGGCASPLLHLFSASLSLQFTPSL